MYRMQSSHPKNPSKAICGVVDQDAPEVPSLNQVVRKISGLIDGNLFPNSDKLSTYDGTTHNLQQPDTSFPEAELPSYLEVADPEYVVDKIAFQIEEGLREGKLAILGPVEVLVPRDLMRQIAQDVVASSETEPCGLRGFIMYINLEKDVASMSEKNRNLSGDNNNCNSKEFQRITCLRPIGSNPVPTFELTLNLKRCKTGWFNSVSSKLFHNPLFGGRQPIVISESYQLSKKKLFR